MIKRLCQVVCITLPLIFTSCIKDGYDTENCPGQYTITPITPEELGLDKNIELKETNTTIIYPDGKARTTEVGSDKVLDLYSGTHKVISVKGENENVKIDKTIVSVAASEKGLANDPSAFIGGYKDIEIPYSVSDLGTVNYNIPTKVQTRQLILKVKLEGANTSFVESIVGNVSGVALARDLNYAFSNNGTPDRYPALKTGSVSYVLNEMSEDNYLTDTRRLLGLDGNSSQELAITIDYSGNTTKVYQFDITGKMDGFHTKEVTSPWVIELTIHLGADFQADIEDWKVGPEIWLDAQH